MSLYLEGHRVLCGTLQESGKVYMVSQFTVGMLECQLAVVRTLSGGEHGIVLGGSSLYLSAASEGWVIGICSVSE